MSVPETSLSSDTLLSQLMVQSLHHQCSMFPVSRAGCGKGSRHKLFFFFLTNLFNFLYGGGFIKSPSQALDGAPTRFCKLLPFEVFSFSFPKVFLWCFLLSERITGKHVGFMSHYVEGSRR